MCQLHSTITEAGNNAVGCRVVQQFTGGHKCKLLSRSSLFTKPNNRDSGTLLAAYGDEATHSVSKNTEYFAFLFMVINFNGYKSFREGTEFSFLQEQ